MKYLASLLILAVFFVGCDSDSSTDSPVQSIKNAPQPTLENSELQPPKPPSL